VLVKQYGLSDRQGRAIKHILEHGSLTIQEFERLCPDVNRRTLQRDLKAMVNEGVLLSEGATNQLIYQIKG
jgi:predicted DNA-binding transcriptional regulator YafY